MISHTLPICYELHKKGCFYLARHQRKTEEEKFFNTYKEAPVFEAMESETYQYLRIFALSSNEDDRLHIITSLPCL